MKYLWTIISVFIVLVILWGSYSALNKPAGDGLVVATSTESVVVSTSTNVSGQTLINNDKKMEHIATIKTNLGEIEIQLLADKAPKTVENFEKLASTGFYNDTLFHRVIKDFMIQGGDPNSKDHQNWATHGMGGPGYAFADEFNDVKLEKGILAMANAGPNTNGSQFFIVTAAATPWLDGKHTAFGKVIKGMEVVEKIENVKVGAADHPTDNVIVESISVK